jgi:hypothetical protein
MARHRPTAALRQSPAAVSSSAGPPTRLPNPHHLNPIRTSNRSGAKPRPRRRRIRKFSPRFARRSRSSRKSNQRIARRRNRPQNRRRPAKPQSRAARPKRSRRQSRVPRKRLPRPSRAARPKRPQPSRRKSGAPEHRQRQTRQRRSNPTRCDRLDFRPAGRRSDLIYRAARHLDRIHLGRHRLALRPQPRQGVKGAHQQQQHYSVERKRRRASRRRCRSRSRIPLLVVDLRLEILSRLRVGRGRIVEHVHLAAVLIDHGRRRNLLGAFGDRGFVPR